MTRTMKRFADGDPARELDPPPDEDQLARILQLPHDPPGGATTRRPQARVLRTAAVGLCVLGVGAAVLSALDRPTEPTRDAPPTAAAPRLELAAVAYAKTKIAEGAIQYTATRGVSELAHTDGTVERSTERVEEWHRGRQTHRLQRLSTGTALDHLIGADGVMRQVSETGAYRVVRPSDNQDAANVIAAQQSGFVAEFRARYRAGRLAEDGDTRFAGRPATAYLVTPTTGSLAAGKGLPQPRQVFYIDRETGSPLGYTSKLQTHRAPAGGGSPLTGMSYTQTVLALTQLPATATNLKHLTTLTLKRRRDADGCIRGGLTNARSSDSATRTDCGGAPGAPLPKAMQPTG